MFIALHEHDLKVPDEIPFNSHLMNFGDFWCSFDMREEEPKLTFSDNVISPLYKFVLEFEMNCTGYVTQEELFRKALKELKHQNPEYFL